LATLGALAAVASAICYALSALTVRVLTRTDTTASMVFWFMAMVVVFAGALAAPSWVPVRVEHWSLLIGVGILGPGATLRDRGISLRACLCGGTFRIHGAALGGRNRLGCLGSPAERPDADRRRDHHCERLVSHPARTPRSAGCSGRRR